MSRRPLGLSYNSALKRISPAMMDRMRALRRSGMTLKEVSIAMAALGVSVSPASVHNLTNGLEIRRDEKMARVRQDVLTMTIRKAAKESGVSWETARRWCSDMGLKRGRLMA